MFTLALAAVLSTPSADRPPENARQTLELRIYRNDDPAKQKAVLDFAAADLVPALSRAGVGPVGIFTPIADLNEGQSAADVYVLIPYAAASDVGRVRDALAADAEYMSSDFFKDTAKDPNAGRVETSLMRAFSGMPAVEAPGSVTEDRVFELRTYEAHNEERAAKKVAMFNAGEIEVMKEVGLAPVFYGETLAAADAPNLRYIMSGPDLETHRKNFQAFLDHPTWAKLKSDPQYAGTVSKITKTFLKRAEGSQI